MTRVVLVGNAPLARDRSALVDGADYVVRFNVPRTWGAGSGTRFDAWVIANAGGGRHFARQRVFAEAPYRDLPREIWFPRAVEVHRELRARHPDGFIRPLAERDFAQAIVRENRLRQPCTRFDAAFYRRCFARLGAAGEADPTMMPSAGFVATNYVLERFGGCEIVLLGFTFEGWAGHPWRLEEAFMRRKAAEGALELLEA